ncbi:MAG: hypothetical protein ACU0CO_08220, partial [Shimia sp.]
PCRWRRGARSCGPRTLPRGVATGAAGWIAARETLRQFERGLMTNAAVPVPRWPITAVIATGLILAALILLRDAARGSE